MTGSQGKVWTLTLADHPLDAMGILQLHDVTQQAFADGATTLILDFGGVPFIDSHVVNFVVQLAQEAPPDARLAMVGLNRHTQKIAQVTRLDEILEVHKSVDGVLQLVVG